MASTRPRNIRLDFEIHHDAMEGLTEEELQEEPILEEEDEEEEEEYEEDDDDEEEGEEEDDNEGTEDEEDVSEASEESDGVVDTAVQEDIMKLQESFEGIKDRFRLINRIGEGEWRLIGIDCYFIHMAQAPFLLYTKRRTSYTRLMIIHGISKRKKTSNGHRHL